MDRPVSQHGGSEEKMDFKVSSPIHLNEADNRIKFIVCAFCRSLCCTQTSHSKFVPATEGNYLVQG